MVTEENRREQPRPRAPSGDGATDQAALSKIENGERQVTDVEVLGICRALKVEFAELFKGLCLPQE